MISKRGTLALKVGLSILLGLSAAQAQTLVCKTQACGPCLQCLYATLVACPAGSNADSGSSSVCASCNVTNSPSTSCGNNLDGCGTQNGGTGYLGHGCMLSPSTCGYSCSETTPSGTISSNTYSCSQCPSGKGCS